MELRTREGSATDPDCCASCSAIWVIGAAYLMVLRAPLAERDAVCAIGRNLWVNYSPGPEDFETKLYLPQWTSTLFKKQFCLL